MAIKLQVELGLGGGRIVQGDHQPSRAGRSDTVHLWVESAVNAMTMISGEM